MRENTRIKTSSVSSAVACGVMREDKKHMEWIAVRSVYHFGINSKGKNVFEERVVCFEAKDFDEAHDKAKKESELYAEENGFEFYPEQVSYMQDGDKLIDGYEIWSELFESNLSLNEFYKERYEQYIYNPDDA